MATQAGARPAGEFTAYTWLTGLLAGLVSAIVTGLLIQFGFDPTVLSEGIPAGIGMSGMVVGWVVFLAIGAVVGIVYTAVTLVDAIGRYASVPDTGAIVGVGFGLVIWIVAVIVVPLWAGAGDGTIGSYGMNLQSVLSFALFGLLIGLVYSVSPYT